MKCSTIGRCVLLASPRKGRNTFEEPKSIPFEYSSSPLTPGKYSTPLREFDCVLFVEFLVHRRVACCHLHHSPFSPYIHSPSIRSPSLIERVEPSVVHISGQSEPVRIHINHSKLGQRCRTHLRLWIGFFSSAAGLILSTQNSGHNHG